MGAVVRALRPDYSDVPAGPHLRIADASLEALGAPVAPERPWVRPDVWAAALRLAAGDHRRIMRYDYDDVLVVNSPGVYPLWALG